MKAPVSRPCRRIKRHRKRLTGIGGSSAHAHCMSVTCPLHVSDMWSDVNRQLMVALERRQHKKL